MLADDMTDAVLIEFLKVTKDIENIGRGVDQLTFGVMLFKFSFKIVLSSLLLSFCEC